MTLMSSAPEPEIWSCDTGQWIPCFDSCQLTTCITWVSNMKVNQGEAACLGWPWRAPCCATSSPVRSLGPMLLIMMTMLKWMHGVYKHGAPHGGLLSHWSSAINIFICKIHVLDHDDSCFLHPYSINGGKVLMLDVWWVQEFNYMYVTWK